MSHGCMHRWINPPEPNRSILNPSRFGNSDYAPNFSRGSHDVYIAWRPLTSAECVRSEEVSEWIEKGWVIRVWVFCRYSYLVKAKIRVKSRRWWVRRTNWQFYKRLFRILRRLKNPNICFFLSFPNSSTIFLNFYLVLLLGQTWSPITISSGQTIYVTTMMLGGIANSSCWKRWKWIVWSRVWWYHSR